MSKKNNTNRGFLNRSSASISKSHDDFGSMSDDVDPVTRVVVLEDLFFNALCAYFERHPEMLAIVKDQLPAAVEEMESVDEGKSPAKKQKKEDVPPKHSLFPLFHKK